MSWLEVRNFKFDWLWNCVHRMSLISVKYGTWSLKCEVLFHAKFCSDQYIMSHLQSNKMQIWPHFEFWGPLHWLGQIWHTRVNLRCFMPDFRLIPIKRKSGMKEHITAVAGKGNKLQILPNFKFLGEHLCPLLPLHQSGPNLACKSEPVGCFPSLNFSLIRKYCCSCRRKAADRLQTWQSFESWGLFVCTIPLCILAIYGMQKWTCDVAIPDFTYITICCCLCGSRYLIYKISRNLT